ncbi:hypothetical protein Poly51_63340 [Rubripirellula tenax]|uniref:Uncharacterized protein n=1 Tax=Rubripirellula tenax TaxID=2528015 RepID=A0A5C6E4Z9_9BACT|nr:hypothetical protein Poly51_63340 [Rubripirellula tenax]
MPDSPKSLNPYSSPNCETASRGDTIPTWPRYISFLVTSGIVLSLPPIPLFLWLAENEPFHGSARPWHLAFVGIAGIVAVFWFIWAVALVIGIAQRWVAGNAAWYLLLASVAGWISISVVYDFGYDQGWFG